MAPAITAGACFVSAWPGRITGQSISQLDRCQLSCCNTAMHSHGISKWRQHLTLDRPTTEHRPVWLHACSVGEVGSVAPLVEELLQLNVPLHLSVVTKTGFDHASRLFGDRISISYLPWDVPGLMRRFIGQLDPRLLLLTETEFWPGMLALCRKRNIPVVGVNTRISDRSFPRYHASRFLWKRWLSPVSLFLAQSELDAERLADIGVDPVRIQAVGNLKYAINPPITDATDLRKRIDASMVRPVLLAASTHDDEEESLLGMWPKWKRIQPNLLLLLVPRHPERFDTVANQISQHGFQLSRWSEEGTDPQTDIFLIDAMGVLNNLYTVADMAIIGGSLVPVGGHNPLEAAICGRGVITGPYVQNFREVMQDMQQANAAVVAEDKHALDETVQHFLRHPNELKQLNARAADFMQDKTRTLERIMKAIRPFLESS